MTYNVTVKKSFKLLQDALQKGLSHLNSKIGRLEVIHGVDVGIVFLLYALLRLENLRGGDGSIFKGLLIKLFKLLYPYALGSNKSTKKALTDTVVSAICLIIQVAGVDADAHKDQQKTQQLLNFLRSCCFYSSAKGIGKIQIAYTLECICAKNTNNEMKKTEYYAEKYALFCKRRHYLLDNIDTVLCNTEYIKSSGMENQHHSSKNSLPFDAVASFKHSSASSDDGTGSGNEDVFDSLAASPQSTSEQPISFSKEKDEKASQLSEQQPEDKSLRQSLSSAELQNFIEKGVTNEDKKSDGKVAEYLKVPVECAVRILGYEGAILRKLEFQSNAIIELDESMMNPHSLPRPETSALTAHRLVAGALGMSTKLEEEKLKAEQEKLANAKELAMRYKMSTRELEVKITGTSDAVSTAKTLINEIVNYTTFMAVPLPGFTIDQIVESAGERLKTIETLLNVILRLEELEDESVVLHISGDKKSCEDAKRQIINDLGSLRFSLGLLVKMPATLAPILKSNGDVTSFTCKLMELSESHVGQLHSDNNRYLFLRGNSQKVYKAQNILNRLNAELLFGPPEAIEGLRDLFKLMDQIDGKNSLSRQVSRDVTSPVKSRRTYSRGFLIQCSRLPASRELPPALIEILQGDDDVFQAIITIQCNFALGRTVLESESS